MPRTKPKSLWSATAENGLHEDAHENGLDRKRSPNKNESDEPAAKRPEKEKEEEGGDSAESSLLAIMRHDPIRDAILENFDLEDWCRLERVCRMFRGLKRATVSFGPLFAAQKYLFQNTKIVWFFLGSDRPDERLYTVNERISPHSLFLPFFSRMDYRFSWNDYTEFAQLFEVIVNISTAAASNESVAQSRLAGCALKTPKPTQSSCIRTASVPLENSPEVVALSLVWNHLHGDGDDHAIGKIPAELRQIGRRSCGGYDLFELTINNALAGDAARCYASKGILLLNDGAKPEKRHRPFRFIF